MVIMKKLLLILLTSVSMCVMPPIVPAIVPASDVSQNYSTMWLMQWLHQCSSALSPSYRIRGLPEQQAMQKSIYDCSCVIDKFRSNFSQAEVDSMFVEDRHLFSEQYTKDCLGVVTGT
jgi:hypothetical protein